MSATYGGEVVDREAAARAFRHLACWADRVLVLSLPRATDRRARVAERLAGLPFDFFDGVDKLDLDRAALVRDGVFDESRTRRAYRHGREMNLGEIGAALAHRRVYEEMLRQGLERVVVLEDDVVPRVADLAALPAALDELPATFDVCYLGYLGGERVGALDRAKQAVYRALGPLGLVPWTTREARRLLPRPYSPHLRRAGLHMCAHSYAVSLEGARKLLAAQTPVAFRADWALPWIVLNGEAEAFVTEPKFFEAETPADRPSGAPASYIHG